MIKEHMELVLTSRDVNLLEGSFLSPYNHQIRITVIVANFGLPGSEPVSCEIKAAVRFLKQFASLGEVEIALPPRPTWNRPARSIIRDLYTTVAMPILQACHQESSAKQLSVSVDFGIREHLDFLMHDDCSNILTRLVIKTNNIPSTTIDLSKLKALQVLHIAGSETSSIINGRTTFTTTTISHELLAYLVGCNFSKSLNALEIIYCGESPKCATEAINFLEKHKQVTCFMLKVWRAHPEALTILLKKVVQDQGLGLKRVEILGYERDDIDTETTSFFSALKSAIANLSPSIQHLNLKVGAMNFLQIGAMNFDSRSPEAIPKLKEALLAGMKRNKKVLSLETFIFYGWGNEDLSSICSAFATKQKIARACELPRAALPQALEAIKRHPQINPEQQSSTMLFHYMRNDPGLVQQMHIPKKNPLKRTTEGSSTGASAKHPRV